MKLAISNIAWEPDEEPEVRELLRRRDVTEVEVAPTRNWPDPLTAGSDSISNYRSFWESASIRIRAMQALLFGHPELRIFEDDAKREQTCRYLLQVMRLGAGLGATVLVFGSPNNRMVGNLPKDEATAIAVEFFRHIGAAAIRHGLLFCIEPNPAEYGCDFVRTMSEGVSLVRRVASDGFRLHLDSSAMILNGEDYERALAEGIEYAAHFHISEPYLARLGDHRRAHVRIAAQLRALGYGHTVSIEMRKGQEGSNVEAVERALEFAGDVYLR